MNLQTGFDCSQAGTSQLESLNNVNSGTMVPAYFELSTGLDGCVVLNNDGEIIQNERYEILQAITSGNYPNLQIGFYHALYDPTFYPSAMSCYEQGAVFGMSLANQYIPSTYLLLVLDVEEFTFNDNNVTLEHVESCVQEFMNGLESTISGNFEVMIYTDINEMKYLCQPPMNTSSSLTAANLWLANALVSQGFDYSFFEPTNPQIENYMYDAVNWSGGIAGWQYAESNIVDLDIFDLDIIYNANMSYSLIN